MRNTTRYLLRKLSCERGATACETALLLSLLALVVQVSVASLGAEMALAFETAAVATGGGTEGIEPPPPPP